MTEVVDGLHVDAERMRANLAITNGQILAEAATEALGPHLGRARAREVVEQAGRRATEQGRHLRDTLADEPQVQAHLSAAELDRLFDPTTYLGLAPRLVERALAARKE
jgi:3-carboxy-cis,cis-muconate cycloisomerase